MQSGSIDVTRSPDGLDLQSTLESGQTFLWRRVDGEAYDEARAYGGDAWYRTVADGEVVFARQRDGVLEWRATTDATELLRRRLRLDDDLDAVFAGFPDEPRLAAARRAVPGLRVVRDPFFPCLISFVCSARTPVARIHAFQRRLARAFGDAVTVGEETVGDGTVGEETLEAESDDPGIPDRTTYHAFPRPDRLAAASEEELRELGLGFRAPYVVETAETVASGELTEADLRDLSYRDARERLQAFHGAGPKVADCVSLFALGHLEAVPVDRWTRRLVERHFPADAADGYEATADAFRDRFGDRAGYAQTYLFHTERS